MTVSRANKINGLEYEKRGYVWVALDSTGSIVASMHFKKNDSDTLKRLVEAVYAVNRQLAFERDGWKCTECGSYRQLECDHKVARGMGGMNRDDRVDNLRTLCHSHHAIRHGLKVVQYA
jgi:hypothetical protein